MPASRKSRAKKSTMKSGGGGGKHQMYCVKCRQKVACTNAKIGKDRRGRARLSGSCPHCGTKMFKYIKM